MADDIDTSNKRTEKERERDRTIVAHLYVEGHTQEQIAHSINRDRPEEKQISRSQIRYDIAKLREEWREARLTDTEEALLRQLAIYRKVQAEAWTRLRRSAQENEKIVIEDGVDQLGRPTKKITTTKEGQAGDARWLEVLLRALAGEARLLGLNVETKFEHESPVQFVMVKMPPGQTVVEYEQVVQQLGVVNGTIGGHLN